MQVFFLVVAGFLTGLVFFLGAFGAGIFCVLVIVFAIPLFLVKLVRYIELDLVHGTLNMPTYGFYTWRVPLSSIREVRISDYSDRFLSWKLASPYTSRVTIVRHNRLNILVSPVDQSMFITTIRRAISPDFV